MNAMPETNSPAEYKALLRADFASFARHSFHLLNPRTPFVPGWHFEVIAAKLAAVRAGHIWRLIVNMPPRHLKSHLVSVASRHCVLGHELRLQILCVSYAQDVLRRRMEYPELKRAVREQCQAFDANVVLIPTDCASQPARPESLSVSARRLGILRS